MDDIFLQLKQLLAESAVGDFQELTYREVARALRIAPDLAQRLLCEFLENNNDEDLSVRYVLCSGTHIHVANGPLENIVQRYPDVTAISIYSISNVAPSIATDSQRWIRESRVVNDKLASARADGKLWTSRYAGDIVCEGEVQARRFGQEEEKQLPTEKREKRNDDTEEAERKKRKLEEPKARPNESPVKQAASSLLSSKKEGRKEARTCLTFGATKAVGTTGKASVVDAVSSHTRIGGSGSSTDKAAFAPNQLFRAKTQCADNSHVADGEQHAASKQTSSSSLGTSSRSSSSSTDHATTAERRQQLAARDSGVSRNAQTPAVGADSVEMISSDQGDEKTPWPPSSSEGPLESCPRSGGSSDSSHASARPAVTEGAPKHGPATDKGLVSQQTKSNEKEEEGEIQAVNVLSTERATSGGFAEDLFGPDPEIPEEPKETESSSADDSGKQTTFKASSPSTSSLSDPQRPRKVKQKVTHEKVFQEGTSLVLEDVDEMMETEVTEERPSAAQPSRPSLIKTGSSSSAGRVKSSQSSSGRQASLKAFFKPKVAP